jgi:ParB family chromosome partitioning protein
MTQPRRGLGRGLDALFSGSASVAEPPPPPPPVAAQPEPAAPAPPPARRGTPEEIDIDLISPNPDQPRLYFDSGQLEELIDSIREHGIIQPLIVTRAPDGGFRLIAGERRLQAARSAGLQTVPVVFREATDDDLLELALIENIQRADLNPIEEALAYRRLVDDHGYTQEETARRVGKSRVTVANALRLLALEMEIRASVTSGEITEGHARALLGLPEGKTRLAAWRDVVKKRLSVRDTEAYVRRTLADSPARPGSSAGSNQTAQRDSAMKDVESRLRRALGTRVTVVPQRSGARITIDCYSGEEFRNVVAQLLGADDEEEDE